MEHARQRWSEGSPEPAVRTLGDASEILSVYPVARLPLPFVLQQSTLHPSAPLATSAYPFKPEL
jgi:hypothetical protein